MLQVSYIQFLLMLVTSLTLISCSNHSDNPTTTPFLIVLGVAQDAGYPQAGCAKSCCKPAWANEKKRRKVSCLALVDPATSSYWIFDATPDFTEQMNMACNLAGLPVNQLPTGIFLTHGHIGHYTGLMNLGREVIGSNGVPVYTMPRMEAFLTENGPWSQLVELQNIKLNPLQADQSIPLTSDLKVTPFLVPHRDEFTETIGYEITGPNKSALFIPDIDKWNKWDRDILAEIEKADFAFLDGTFYSDGELPGRNMNEIPHPFVSESVETFKSLHNKEKVHFIHFNHTNPLLVENSGALNEIEAAGFNIARELDMIGL